MYSARDGEVTAEVVALLFVVDEAIVVEFLSRLTTAVMLRPRTFTAEDCSGIADDPDELISVTMLELLLLRAMATASVVVEDGEADEATEVAEKLRVLVIVFPSAVYIWVWLAVGRAAESGLGIILELKTRLADGVPETASEPN